VNAEQRTSGERGRGSSRRKTEIVLRVLRGEDLDALSRELGVTAGTIAQWCEQFLAVRHDHGSPFMSDSFQGELRFLGIT
jgi:hypothetical protein